MVFLSAARLREPLEGVRERGMERKKNVVAAKKNTS